MNILVGCERSGIVRDALIARGHNAISCDLFPSARPGPHFQGDVLLLLELGWDAALFFPDCTFLCSSGLHWNKRVHGREEKTAAAVDFALRLWNCKIPIVVIENPIGRLGKVLPTSARQIIQPNEYGADASKATCLWRRGGIPKLQPTNHIAPRLVEWPIGSGKIVKRWGNQTDSGQNKLAPSDDRAMLRAETYHGVANAFAEQWF